MPLNTPPLATPSAHVCTPQTPADYIAALPNWDSVPRLDTWLPHVLNVTPKGVGMYRMEYLALTGRYWLLAMTHRALEPGCKFDQCLVLEGPGGTGKSTLLEALAGRDFFRDEPFFDKDWCIGDLVDFPNAWLCEISDLAAFGNADKQALKAFITTNNDEYRPPYHKEIKLFPRQFVIAGTTNDSAWRRKSTTHYFWPVPVSYAINTQWVHMHRAQLFAEAKARMHELGDMQDLSSHPGNPVAARSGGAAC